MWALSKERWRQESSLNVQSLQLCFLFVGCFFSAVVFGSYFNDETKLFKSHMVNKRYENQGQKT